MRVDGMWIYNVLSGLTCLILYLQVGLLYTSDRSSSEQSEGRDN